MKAEQLDQIIAAAPDAMRTVLGELHEHILEGAAQALAKSQDSDDGGKPKVTATLKLVIGLNTSLPNWQVKGNVGVTYSAESEAQILEDPRQQILPFTNMLGPGDSVTITSTGGKGTKISKDKDGKVETAKIGGSAE